MTNLDTIEVHSRAITAFFETEAAAKKAVAHLEREGIPSRHITLVAGDSSAAVSANTASTGTGFMASLKNLFLPDEDQHAYAEGLRRGGYVLSVNTDEANYNKVLDILDVDGSVDMDEREATWKSEGWKGYDAATTPLATGSVAAVSDATALRQTTTAEAAPSRPLTEAPAALNAGQDETIKLYEEKLSVGKRDVSHGRVRLRSYVVTTPVTESVNLRSETVTIDRRPVDRPVAAADLGVDAFKDRTIEMEETAEEAVIAKTARVVEEIGIRKAVTDRNQVVTDTVRSTKVDIEDGRSTGVAAPLFEDASVLQRAKDMEVLGSDGEHVGVVDHVDGPSIKLKRMDADSGGSHHLIPIDWVHTVDQKVRLKVTAADAKSRWTAA